MTEAENHQLDLERIQRLDEITNYVRLALIKTPPSRLSGLVFAGTAGSFVYMVSETEQYEITIKEL